MRKTQKDKAFDQFLERITFQFKLIAVMTGDSCLSTAEIESNVSARGKKKIPVIITMCKNHIQLQYQKASKNQHKVLALSSLANIHGITRIPSEPRAVGFSVFKCNAPQKKYVTFILIAKQHPRFNRKSNKETFADILERKISEACTKKHEDYDSDTPASEVSSLSSGSAVSYVQCYKTYPKQVQQQESDTIDTEYNICYISPHLITDPEPTCTKKDQPPIPDDPSTWPRHLFVSKGDIWGNPNASIRHWPPQNFQFSDYFFFSKSGLFHRADMFVPLHSREAAWCSRKRVFEYVPQHVRDPTWNLTTPPFDCVIPSRQLRDLNDSSIPDHMRKGVDDNDSEPVEFSPEFEVTKEHDSEQKWFSGRFRTAIIVGPTWNNGLQQLPTVPTRNFIHRIELLFDAYLKPEMYYERNFAITNNPEKLAKFLASTDDPEMETILSYRDKKLSDCWYIPPCCTLDAQQQFVLE